MQACELQCRLHTYPTGITEHNLIWYIRVISLTPDANDVSCGLIHCRTWFVY